MPNTCHRRKQCPSSQKAAPHIIHGITEQSPTCQAVHSRQLAVPSPKSTRCWLPSDPQCWPRNCLKGSLEFCAAISMVRILRLCERQSNFPVGATQPHSGESTLPDPSQYSWQPASIPFIFKESFSLLLQRNWFYRCTPQTKAAQIGGFHLLSLKIYLKPKKGAERPPKKTSPQTPRGKPKAVGPCETLSHKVRRHQIPNKSQEIPKLGHPVERLE